MQKKKKPTKRLTDLKWSPEYTWYICMVTGAMSDSRWRRADQTRETFIFDLQTIYICRSIYTINIEYYLEKLSTEKM